MGKRTIALATGALLATAGGAVAALPPTGIHGYTAQLATPALTGTAYFDTYHYGSHVGINAFSNSTTGRCSHGFLERVSSPQAGGSLREDKIRSDGTFSFSIHDTRHHEWRLAVSGRFTAADAARVRIRISKVIGRTVRCTSGTVTAQFMRDPSG